MLILRPSCFCGTFCAIIKLNPLSNLRHFRPKAHLTLGLIYLDTISDISCLPYGKLSLFAKLFAPHMHSVFHPCRNTYFAVLYIDFMNYMRVALEQQLNIYLQY